MDGKIFVILIIAISTFGWLASSWIRARHGYPLENEWSGTTQKGNPDSERRIERRELRLGLGIRAVVDDDQLVVPEGLGAESREQLVDEMPAIVAGHHDADGRDCFGRGHGGRFRARGKRFTP